jgi:hypothetical protein
MSTAQRVSRGFHRLAVFLAAIPLVVGSGVSIFIALDQANAAKRSHDEQLELVCALGRAETAQKKVGEKQPLTDEEVLALPPEGTNFFDRFDKKYDLKEIGCSEHWRKVSWNDVVEARAPGEFNYFVEFALPLFIGLAISLAGAIAVYGIVRAIGWVIGGFAAS